MLSVCKTFLAVLILSSIANARLISPHLDFYNVSMQSTVTARGEEEARTRAHAMLKYLNGNFYVYNGSMRRDAYSLQILSSPAGSRWKDKVYTFRIDFTVAIPESMGNPGTLDAYIPSEGTDESISLFYGAAIKGNCVFEEGNLPVSPALLFHYYRPHRYGNCLQVLETSKWVKRATVTFHQRIPESPQAKPQLHRIWENGRMDITIVFQSFKKEDHDVTISRVKFPNRDDLGVDAFRTFLEDLIRERGIPDQIDFEDGEATSVEDRTRAFIEEGTYASMVYNKGRVSQLGPVFFHFYLTRKVDWMWQKRSFARHLKSRGALTDLLMFNGHSDTAGNVDEYLAKILKGESGRNYIEALDGKYAVVYVNSCNNYFFHRPEKYTEQKLKVDVILNSQTSYFTDYPAESLNVLNGFLNEDVHGGQVIGQSFEDILIDLDRGEVPLANIMSQ